MNRRAEILVTAAFCMSVAACQHSRQDLRPADNGAKQAPPQIASVVGIQQSLGTNRPLLAADPASTKHWVALGNEYFDSGQREKAVEAYGKALQLEPNNPDVLTDQGVMYRELGAFDKAIANFEKASTIDPRHLTSLLDLGVLYAEDLKDQDKAIKTWNRVIQIAPTSPQAAKAHAYVEQLKQVPEPR